ncbi:zonadhesin-like, partial [Sitodiplosis mosellana]|uniref:zonadhesin-like n=1 Tax=Sitodiplosis mosellana TaxID=263140 RepID=UPI0024438E4B
KSFSTEHSSFAPTESGRTTKYFDTTTEQFRTSSFIPKETTSVGEGRFFTSTESIDQIPTLLPTDRAFATEQSSLAPTEGTTKKYIDSTTEKFKTSTFVPKYTTTSDEDGMSSTTQFVDHETIFTSTEKAFVTEQNLPSASGSGKTTKYIDTTTEQFRTSTHLPKATTLPSEERTSPITQTGHATTILPAEKSFVTEQSSFAPSEGGRTTKQFDITTEQTKTSTAGYKVTTLPGDELTTVGGDEKMFTTTQYIDRKTTLLPTEKSLVPTEGITTTKHVDTTTEQFQTSSFAPRETTLPTGMKMPYTTQSIEHESTILPTEETFASERSSFVPTESGQTTKSVDTTTEQVRTSTLPSRMTTLSSEGKMFTTTDQSGDREMTLPPTEKAFVTEHIPIESGRTTKYVDTTTDQFKTSSYAPKETTIPVDHETKISPTDRSVVTEHTTEQYRTSTLTSKATTIPSEEDLPTTQSIDHETTMLPTEKTFVSERSSFVPTESGTTKKYVDTTTDQFKTSGFTPKVTTLASKDRIPSTTHYIDHETTVLVTDKSFGTESGTTIKYVDSTTEKYKTSTFVPKMTTIAGEEKMLTTTHFFDDESTKRPTEKTSATEQSSFIPTEGGKTTKYFDTTTEQMKTSTGTPPRATTLPSEHEIPSTTQFVDYETTLSPTEKTFGTERSSFSPTESGTTTKYAETTTQELRTSSVPHKVTTEFSEAIPSTTQF